tara:strand:- start:1766 stop:1966 length:201 start_codon:yes stop_codon:yes gene_type:complete
LVIKITNERQINNTNIMIEVNKPRVKYFHPFFLKPHSIPKMKITGIIEIGNKGRKISPITNQVTFL